jgi:hypothetical protein
MHHKRRIGNRLSVYICCDAFDMQCIVNINKKKRDVNPTGGKFTLTMHITH